MLGVTLVQVVFAITAIYFGAKRRDGVRPRRARHACSVASPSFSAADVNRFGSSSLITRITNDVQQVQMLVVMICTLFVAAPIMIVGGCSWRSVEDGPLSLILVVAIPALVHQRRHGRHPADPAVREHAGAHRPRQPGPARADHRHARGAGVRAGARRRRALRRRQRNRSPSTSLRAGRLQAFMFPSVMLVLNVSSVAAVWFGGNAHRRGRDADRHDDRVPHLPHPDPHRGDDGARSSR